MTDRAHEPTARSAAERRLDRAHDNTGRRQRDALRSRLEEKRRELVELELHIARQIGDHPDVNAPALEVLSWVDHDGDRLLALFRDVYSLSEGASPCRP